MGNSRTNQQNAEPNIRKHNDTSEDVMLFQGNESIYPDHLKGLATDPKDESMINVDTQEEQLQVAI